jgi:hypothetical protein
MTLKVKLNDIIEAMESQSDETNAYLNKKTGMVELIADEYINAAEENLPREDDPQWFREIVQVAKQILEMDDFISLPSLFDINEYTIMEKFSLSIPDSKLSDELYYSIKGKGAFKKFKKSIRLHRIEADWYTFKHEALKEIAKDWCDKNSLTYE